MELTLQNFTPAEQATFRLRALYEQGGYRKYRASRFEEYALYQEYQHQAGRNAVHRQDGPARPRRVQTLLL